MALDAKKKRLLTRLRQEPYLIAHKLGFTKLTKLHNKWIVSMIYGQNDATLQAHRGSYKTTCVAFALALIIVLYPNCKTLFVRKTDTDVKEIIKQVRNILDSGIMRQIVYILHGVNLVFRKDTESEIDTNLSTDVKGTSQLLGKGTQTSITGKHYDRIFTDDIVTLIDRVSKAAREKAKIFYQELQNVINRGGRIFNTGTPWHKDDAFLLMPNAERYTCYDTGLISAEEIESLRASMSASLFAANYELKHIANDNVLFSHPVTGGDFAKLEHGYSHIDASYGGADSSAFTIANKKDGKYYVLGKLRQKHIDACKGEFIAYHNRAMCTLLSCEDNGDKGYLAKDIKAQGVRVGVYHESMNKYLKIASYLKAVWKDIIFVEGTDKEYIEQITDYNIDAEHDDAPDSLASLIRQLWGKNEPQPSAFL